MVIETKQAGDRLGADEFNAVARNTRHVQRSAEGARLGNAAKPRTQSLQEAALTASALNYDGGEANLLMYAPCGLDGHVFSGADAEAKRVLKAHVPISGDEGFFGVCAEPVKFGYVGRVHVAGVCLARIVNPDGFDFCEISPGADYLLGAEEGGAQILWEEAFSGSDVHLGLIRFPHGGGGGSPPPSRVAVASTGNEDLEGHPTMDGVATDNEDLVLLKNQTDPSENGVYNVLDDAWEFQGRPGVVYVISGDEGGKLTFVLTDAYTYTPFGAVYL